MIKATFLMEQHIGHRAYYNNLRGCIDAIPEVNPKWIEITYQDENSLWQRIPGLPGGMRGILIGRSQALRGQKIPSDVLFFNTQVPAVLSGGPRRPYLVATDITPIQYDRMGSVYGHRPDRKNLPGLIKHALNTRILQNAAYLLPWSSWAASSLKTDYGVNPSRIEVLPPGVDLAVWRPVQNKKPGPVRILFVGGDFHRKGGDDLLKAFQSLPESLSGQVELALVTRSPLPPYPGVRVFSDLQPNSAEIVRLYQSSDVFVLPSLAEAFGIAAVEASAVGLPVIAAKTGGLRDIVEDGVTGFLIEPGNLGQLTERLGELTTDRALRDRMGQAGRKRAELLFNASRNTARLVQIICDVVRKG
jgi:glycosyltransferase involved in cell wall biosynthesis